MFTCPGLNQYCYSTTLTFTAPLQIPFCPNHLKAGQRDAELGDRLLQPHLHEKQSCVAKTSSALQARPSYLRELSCSLSWWREELVCVSSFSLSSLLLLYIHNMPTSSGIWVLGPCTIWVLEISISCTCLWTAFLLLWLLISTGAKKNVKVMKEIPQTGQNPSWNEHQSKNQRLQWRRLCWKKKKSEFIQNQ